MEPMKQARGEPAEVAGVATKIDVPHETLGEWCIRTGLATPEEIEACLKIQRAAESQNRPAPRLGEILVARGILTHHQVNLALAAQKKEIRQSPRCGIQ